NILWSEFYFDLDVQDFSDTAQFLTLSKFTTLVNCNTLYQTLFQTFYRLCVDRIRTRFRNGGWSWTFSNRPCGCNLGVPISVGNQGGVLINKCAGPHLPLRNAKLT